MKKYGLPARNIIKKKKDFELFFSSGKFVSSANKKIKAIFLVEVNDETPGIKIAAAVSKKQGNAVWRNKFKRLVKESYRLNKEILTGTCLEKKLLLNIIFSPFSLNQKNNKKIYLDDVRSDMVEILTKIKSRL